jgi:hypothetical protein
VRHNVSVKLLDFYRKEGLVIFIHKKYVGKIIYWISRMAKARVQGLKLLAQYTYRLV